MNIKNLEKAKKILKGEFNIKDYGKREFSLLVEAINSLEILIKRLEDPKKARKLDKLIGEEW